MQQWEKEARALLRRVRAAGPTPQCFAHLGRGVVVGQGAGRGRVLAMLGNLNLQLDATGYSVLSQVIRRDGEWIAITSMPASDLAELDVAVIQAAAATVGLSPYCEDWPAAWGVVNGAADELFAAVAAT